MITYNLEVDDKSGLDDLKAKLADQVTYDATLHQIGGYIQRRTRDRFDEQVDVAGQAFAPLSEKYAKWKRKKPKAASEIMQFDRTLRNSIVVELESDGVSLNSQAKYARVHNLGSSKMPQRQYLGINADDEAEILGIIEDAYKPPSA